MRLSQSFASAFLMKPPKLMNEKDLPAEQKHAQCPADGVTLTFKSSGGAFLDGCYKNTTRQQDRNEKTGEEAQHYLYMWKYACAYTKWVPSNQFMYANIDYNPDTMTLERFGFIGMDRRCFWGSIGVLWKRPLPVEQILPNITLTTEEHPPLPAVTPNTPPPPPPPKPKPAAPALPPPQLPTGDVIPKQKEGSWEIQSIVNPGTNVHIDDNDVKKVTFQNRQEASMN